MKSLVKREINISITAHVELVTQMILDCYEINLHRIEKEKRLGIPYCPGNMLYHRMLRATGHTAALKKLLSNEFYEKSGINVFGAFHCETELEFALKNSRNVRTGEEFPAPEIDKRKRMGTINRWIGTAISEANIIIFSDTLHDKQRLDNVHKFINENATCFPNLRLVVILG